MDFVNCHLVQNLEFAGVFEVRDSRSSISREILNTTSVIDDGRVFGWRRFLKDNFANNGFKMRKSLRFWRFWISDSHFLGNFEQLIRLEPFLILHLIGGHAYLDCRFSHTMVGSDSEDASCVHGGEPSYALLFNEIEMLSSNIKHPRFWTTPPVRRCQPRYTTT